MVFCNIIEHIGRNIKVCHNPYFNRWFSAIITDFKLSDTKIKSQSLF